MSDTYALHPGYVYALDGDRHYIDAARLASLYGLRRGEWIRWDYRDHATHCGRLHGDYVHLSPAQPRRVYESVAAEIAAGRARNL